MKLITDIRNAYRYYSMWLMAFVVMIPELYPQAIAIFGGAGPSTTRVMQIVAVGALIARVIRQAKPVPPLPPDDVDDTGAPSA